MQNRERSWRDEPRAARLLRICAFEHPRLHEFRYAFGDTDERYAGSIVTKLNGIYRRHRSRLLAEADCTGDYSAFHAHCADSVTSAINDAIVTARAAAA